MKIGVLALQGAFAEHEAKLRELDAATLQIRQRRDFTDSLDGLVLPGGESTVQGRLLRELGLLEPVRRAIAGGLPVLGTCAGLILLAREISGAEEPHLGTMAIRVRRNAYGRQLGSFRTEAQLGHVGRVPMTFIRGPYVEEAGPKVEVLARVDGRIVAVRQQNQLGLAFHPELAESSQVHRFFLELAAGRKQSRLDVGESLSHAR